MPAAVLRRVLVPFVAFVMGLLIAFGAGLAGGDTLETPGDDSAAAGFARDMSTHHAQAVTMAETIRDRTDEEELRLLASDIALTQQSQIGRMQGWLDTWGLPRTGAGPPLAWADLSSGQAMGEMPGMAGADDLATLAEAPVEEAEGLFLELMIRHHTAGVAMAEAALARDVPREVRTLAQGIVESQRSEIDLMRQMLRERAREETQ